MSSPFEAGVPQEYVAPVRAGHRLPMGYQQITSLGSAVGLTVPHGARFALIQPQTQSVRWRDDGTNPTASVGMLLGDGDTLEYSGDLTALTVIETGASATLNISYYA